MEDGAPNDTGRPRRWLVAAAAAFVVLPSIVLGAVWFISGERQIVPGLEGCRFVRERQAQIDCYSKQFRTLVREQGLADALTTVDRSAARVVTLGADCHLAWHPLGERAGRRAGASGDPFDRITAATSCQQGYAHGYTIGYLAAADPTDDELVQIVRDDCSTDPDVNQLLNCMHAYGHSIARRSPRDINAAIDVCNRIDYRQLPGADVESVLPGQLPPVVEGAQHQCLYGAFMEFGILDLARGDRTANNCTDVRGRLPRRACYAYLSARVGAINGDLESAARACHELAPKGEPRDVCVKTFALGLDSAKRCSMLITRAERADCRDVITEHRANAGNANRSVTPSKSDQGAPESMPPTDVPAP